MTLHLSSYQSWCGYYANVCTDNQRDLPTGILDMKNTKRTLNSLYMTKRRLDGTRYLKAAYALCGRKYRVDTLAQWRIKKINHRIKMPTGGQQESYNSSYTTHSMCGRFVTIIFTKRRNSRRVILYRRSYRWRWKTGTNWHWLWRRSLKNTSRCPCFNGKLTQLSNCKAGFWWWGNNGITKSDSSKMMITVKGNKIITLDHNKNIATLLLDK